LKAFHHILVSGGWFQALSTQASSIQPAPPHLDEGHPRLLREITVTQGLSGTGYSTHVCS
jgi:hypothetical protein